MARDRLRGCRVLREALSGAETRHVAAHCGAGTVTCASEAPEPAKETTENTDAARFDEETRASTIPTAAEAAALLGVADARAERVARLVTERARLFAERDDDDSGEAFLIVDGVAELVTENDDERSLHGAGELLGATQLLTGSKPDATARAAPGCASVSATAIHPAALRAAADRRPVVLDAIATSVARRETTRLFRTESTTETASEKTLTPETTLALEAAVARRAARLVAAAEARFGNARFAWRRAAETTLASTRKKKHADALKRGGVDAFVAAALGVAGAAETDETRNEEREQRDASSCRRPSKAERDARKFARGVPDEKLPREVARAAPFRWALPREAIALVARGARRVRATRDGEPLCVQGHAAATAFVVLKGKLEALEKSSSSSSAAAAADESSGGFPYGSRVNVLSRGDVIGADSLFTGAPRGATVFAVSQEAWVLEIQRHAVADLARRRPSALDEMAAAVAPVFFSRAECGARTRVDARTHPYLRALAAVESWITRGERHDALRPEVLSGTGGATRARLAFGAPTRLALAALEGAAVFEGVDRIRKLVLLHDAARLVTHPPGSAVVKQGDDGDTMFAVVRGTLDVVVERLASDGDDRRRRASRGAIGVDLRDVVRERARVLEPGDVFGELSLLTGAPRNATVRAAGGGPEDADASRRLGGFRQSPDAVLVEIGASAVAPLLRNRDTNFARSASLATARRYAPRRVEAYAEKLERTMRRFHVAATSVDAATRLSGTTTRVAARALRSGALGEDATLPTSPPSAEDEEKKTKPDAKSTRRREKNASLRVSTEEATAKREGREAFTETFARRLAVHPFFALLTRGELETLKSASRLRRARAGGWLKKKGDVADSCLVLVAGVAIARFETRDVSPSGSRAVTATEELRPWCCVGARHAILHGIDREADEEGDAENEKGDAEGALNDERRLEKNVSSSSSAKKARFVWPATLAAAPPSAEAVEIPGSAIAEIIRARPTLRVLVDGLDAEGRLR